MQTAINTGIGDVRIGKKTLGDGHPCYFIAEIGINHNGDIDLAKRLINVASVRWPRRSHPKKEPLTSFTQPMSLQSRARIHLEQLMAI